MALDPLEHVPGGTGDDRRHERLLVGEGGEHEHPDLRETLTDLATRFDARAVRESDIEDHDIGVVKPDPSHGVGRRPGFAHDLDVILGVEHRPKPFSDDLVIVDKQHLHVITSHARVTVGTLAARMQRIPIERFTVLIQAAAAVAGQVELRSVLETTVEMAVETTGARYGALGVIGEHGTLIDFIYTGMTRSEASRIGPPPVGKGVLGALIEHPEPIRLDHITDHPASSGFPVNHPPMGSFLGVPVRVTDQVFGNLYLTDKPGGFDEEDEQLVIALASVAGSAVSAARLHDRLTRVALAEDRERIARDLHDSVIQDLFATGLGLQGLSMSLDDPRAAQRLDDAIERIDTAISSLRSFIFDIRSFGTTVADPERTIRRLVERLVGDRPIDVTVRIADVSTSPPELLDDALGVIREAVSNAVRHSGATVLGVDVDTSDSGLCIVVRDNGRGFEQTGVKRGMGLDNLQARATNRAGSVTVESAPGVGTTVTTVFPE